MSEIASEVQQLMKEFEPDFLERFRHLHQIPEMSFEEYKTTAYIKEKLSGWGIEIQDIGSETGVIGLLTGASEGPCIGLRADIDALPVKEEASCPYPSKTEGMMHA